MNDNWEEVPQEDLWMDGELNSNQVKDVIYLKVIKEGDWKLVRRRKWDPDHIKKKYKQTPTVL
jgi:hypothetical protein